MDNTNTQTEASAVQVAGNYKTWSGYNGGKLYLVIDFKSGNVVNNTAFNYREIVSFRRFFPSYIFKFQAVKPGDSVNGEII